jgi:DNA-directed RNA polymerase subunit L
MVVTTDWKTVSTTTNLQPCKSQANYSIVHPIVGRDNLRLERAEGIRVFKMTNTEARYIQRQQDKKVRLEKEVRLVYRGVAYTK